MASNQVSFPLLGARPPSCGTLGRGVVTAVASSQHWEKGSTKVAALLPLAWPQNEHMLN